MTKKELMDLLRDAPDDAKVLIAINSSMEMCEAGEVSVVNVVYSRNLDLYILEDDIEMYIEDPKIEGKAEAAVCMEY